MTLEDKINGMFPKSDGHTKAFIKTCVAEYTISQLLEVKMYVPEHVAERIDRIIREVEDE